MTIAWFLAVSFFIMALQALGYGAPPGLTCDVHRVRTGLFIYHDLDHGKIVGDDTVTIRRLARESYQFVGEAQFKTGFGRFESQQWHVTTGRTCAPVAADLAFVQSSGISPVFEIAYRPGRVTGFVMVRSGSDIAKRAVDDAVPSDVIDQRVDWAAVLARDLAPGVSFEFAVYDPATGLGSVRAQVGPLLNVSVPAGRFKAYRIDYEIEKATKREHYVIFVTSDSPRVMVREEFPNGVVSELRAFGRSP